MHVKKGDVASDSVDRLLSIVRAGEQQRGKVQARKMKNPIKGKIKRWCPILGCNQVVLDVGRHLCNETIHGMKRDSRQFQRLLRMAKPYIGLSELQDSLVPPPPPIVELQLPREEVDDLQQTKSDRQSITTPEQTEADDGHEDLGAASAPVDVDSSRDDCEGPSLVSPPEQTEADDDREDFAVASAPVDVSSSRDVPSQVSPPEQTEGDNNHEEPPAASAPVDVNSSHDGPSQVSPPEQAEADDNHEDLAAAIAPVDVDSSHDGPSKVSPPEQREGGDDQEDSSEDSSEVGQDESAEDEDYSTSFHPSSVDFFSDPKPQNNRHCWLVKFFEYLSRPTAGDKKQAIRLQHAAQMRNLLEAIDPKGNDILMPSGLRG